MAISRLYTFVDGVVPTAAQINGEFNNIINNALSLISPLAGSLSMGGNSLVFDAAGVSNITSPATTGFTITPGVKSGTPGSTGMVANVVASTCTDSNTAGSGTAALWTGTSLQVPTLKATNTSVTTTDAATFYVAGPPTASTNETITNGWTAYFNGNIKVIGSVGSSTGAFALRSYLSGLTLSTPGSSGTMSIASGVATDSTNVISMALASSISKTTGTWVAGTGNGGLDTGTIANSTWYHFWLIMRPDTGLTDVLFSLSASAPTMPTNYSYRRYIGSAKFGTGVWLKFIQDGDYFQWDVPVADLSVTPNSAIAATATVTVPTGVNVLAIMTVSQSTTAAGGIWTLFSDLSISDTAAASGLAQLQSNTAMGETAQIQIRTNTSAQFRYRMSGADASAALTLNTVGWIDRRGRDS